MATLDFAPRFRTTVGFHRVPTLLTHVIQCVNPVTAVAATGRAAKSADAQKAVRRIEVKAS